MPIKINNIKVPIDSEYDLKEETARILRIPKSEINDFKIVKQSVDARRKNNLQLVYSVLINFNGNESEKVSRLFSNDIQYIEPAQKIQFKTGTKPLSGPVFVAGFGPAGLFSAYILAKNGYNPIVIERGGDIDARSIAVSSFWNGGDLDINNNVQFGEGGAGTFSDGKLTTRINDHRCSEVLKTFIKFGAPEEILWQAKPHIGTDILKIVVKNMREEIIRLGGSVRFLNRLEDIKFNHKITEIKISGQWQSCGALILAIGHSARDTFEMLNKRGVSLVPKAFSAGVRIEHNQRQLDIAQYGSYAGHPKLRHSDYQLACKGKVRSAYSFCMCPGGLVIASTSEEGGVVTNGMSEYKRDMENANSAIVVDVRPEDFNKNSPLDGMYFQRELEQKAFEAGGENYSAPMQTAGEFLNGISPKNHITPSYKPNTVNADLHKILPQFICDTLADGLRFFERKIKGFSAPEVVMTGVETRTSSPIRILRGENFHAMNIIGMYPAGEGAGYAGGIMSSAVDGIKISEKIMEEYSPS